MKEYTNYVTDDIADALLKKSALDSDCYSDGVWPQIWVTNSEFNPKTNCKASAGCYYNIPTIEQVVEWYWDKHHIDINAHHEYTSLLDYECFVGEINENNVGLHEKDSRKEAYLEAIEKAIELI